MQQAAKLYSLFMKRKIKRNFETNNNNNNNTYYIHYMSSVFNK